MKGLLLIVPFLLASCSATVFYPDLTTRIAAPGLVSSWQSLPVWEGTQLRPVDNGNGVQLVEADLAKPKGTIRAVLIGFTLPEGQLATWKSRFPEISWGILLPEGTTPPGVAVFLPDRQEGWKNLGREAAQILRKMGSSNRGISVCVRIDEDPALFSALEAGWRIGGSPGTLQFLKADTGSQDAVVNVQKAILPGTAAVFYLAGPLNSKLVDTVPTGSVFFTEFPSPLIREKAKVSLVLNDEAAAASMLKGLLAAEKRAVFLPLKTIPGSR